MRFVWITALLASSLVGASLAADYSQEDIDSGKVLAELSKTAYANAMARLSAETSTSGCTKDNVHVRREWRKIPGAERIAFREAIECLMRTESVSAFDDFGVLHYHLTPYVHLTASFLLFHRYYVYTYEEAFRTKCGYKGTFPYWEWGLDAHNMSASPLFDGSETSLGGDGEFIPGHPPPFPGVPAGSGGGCVSGFLSDFSVNLGPSGWPDPLKHNPRCLKRDLNTGICALWASLRNTTDVIIDAPNIEAFQALLQGDKRYPPAAPLGIGVHGGGHFAISGDPGGDFYWSPLEPGFYLHHGQIDRLYFVWQNLDWENRQGIFGTGTMNNFPPSRDMTLDDVMDISPLNVPRPLQELIDTIGGSPFCFVYE
ncbi:tyrosinase central domain-containing protein [Colletotrichum truncatum]|uniref:Tyrosinase central domain-containing protein n=1 Tax=Colletotrichum truncatum TaxID=5467 RepID=A0ACC3YF31_COLTU